jgi:branched-chain amino acid transport system ATP-binding protein
MLEVRDLTVHYGRIAALRGTSISVGEGEITGLVGPNGAGKSTLLKAVIGLVEATSGEILLDGKPLRARGEAVRHGIGYVPETRRIFASLSVLENLRLGGSAIGRDLLEQRVDEQLRRFPVLAERRASGGGKLSGGQQQMLAIARALVASPRLLLLDEPTLGLSPVMIDEIFDAIVGLRDEGVTVLLVEQNTVRTLEVADRTYVMRSGGTIAFEGTRAEVEANPAMRDRYLQLL